ncbi:MAG: transposase, partial [Acidobacteriota bacterium]|nr:transposase [Acidobacteriota bacterium]
MQILSYPIAIRGEYQKKIINTLFFFRKVVNFYLRQFYSDKVIEKLDERRYAYQYLENIASQNYYIPSRVNRGLLEIAGRILRSLKDRRELYSFLLETEKEPQDWSSLLLKKKDIYRKSQYIENLKEHALNYLKDNDSLPDDFLDLTRVPQMKNGMITFAPDDENAIKLSYEDGEINVSLKVLKACAEERGEEKEESLSRSDWEWIDFPLSLPDILSKSKDDFSLAKPDLRLDNIKGRLTPVLDFKVKVEEEEEKDSPFFLTVHWSLRKLLTICVFNEDGEQISRPFFLKCNAIQDKLLRIRSEIDRLKSKRDKLPKGCTKAKWYNREIAKRWNKFRGIQKQLSHLASNVIIEIAKVYDCSKIYVEWLGALKSRRFSRELNRKINSTVRQQIFDKVEYKANMCGISFERPISVVYVSQFCPKCGKKGYHVKASDRLNERKKSGGWFYCKNCGYNADKDYVACQNIARKVLWGDKLKGMSKAFV